MRGTLNDQSLIYLQIARMLEDDILRGVYREEEQVPSTNELARGYNINPATAAKGINLLVADGILYKRRGIGMFVSKGYSGGISTAGRPCEAKTKGRLLRRLCETSGEGGGLPGPDRGRNYGHD